MDISRVYGLFLPFFRRRRGRMFLDLMKPAAAERILDVGGYHWFWAMIECANTVVCLNLDIPADPGPVPSRFSYVKGDGTRLPYADGAFDIAFSNSVIEHLGTYENQVRFANEIRRVGRRYWVQTPNRRFFIEPHLVTPLIHFLPRAWQRRLLRWFTVWGLGTKPTPAQVDAFMEEIRLLTEAEMRALFPDAEIRSERFLGFKKSFIAIRG